MLVCTVTDCIFNVSSVKNVDCWILSWILYLNLMVHYHWGSMLDMPGFGSRSSHCMFLEVCSIE